MYTGGVVRALSTLLWPRNPVRGRHWGTERSSCPQRSASGRPLPGPEVGLAADDGVADGNDARLLQQGRDLAQQQLHPRHHHGEVVALCCSELDIGAIRQDLVDRQVPGLSRVSPACLMPRTVGLREPVLNRLPWTRHSRSSAKTSPCGQADG